MKEMLDLIAAQGKDTLLQERIFVLHNTFIQKTSA